MAKILTFDGNGFWKNSFAYERGKLLKLVHVPEEQIKLLVNRTYLELPSPLRYEIETSGITKQDLQ
jgi:hypothetical protein|tara:strand:- start:623 stop:820 length:198 start_codon:yes stop_codon:yes gene_type:complete